MKTKQIKQQNEGLQARPQVTIQTAMVDYTKCEDLRRSTMKDWQWLAAVVCLAVGHLAWAGGVVDSRPAAVASTGPGPGGTWVDQAPEFALDEPSLAAAKERGAAMLKAAPWTVPLPDSSAGPGGGKIHDAGSAVIWSSSYPVEERGTAANSAIAVDKAAGKTLWATSGIFVLAVAAGDRGGEMLLDRSLTANFPGGPNLAIEMMDVAGMKSRWKAALADYTESSLIAGNQVFVGAQVPFLHGYSSLGPNGGGDRAPAQETKLILNLAAYDRQTGARQWTYTLPAGTLFARPCASADGVLYVLVTPSMARHQSTLIALNAGDGKPIFTAHSVGKSRAPAGPPVFDELSPVVVKDGVVAAATSSGDVVGFDAKTGQEKWRELSWRTNPGAGASSFHRGDVEAPVVAGEKFLVRPPQLFWLQPWAQKQEVVAVTEKAGVAYVGVDLKTGKLRWLLPARSEDRSGRIMVTKPLVSDGVMYIVEDLKLLAVPLDSK
jgi:outer membrane protein assembly factor BamB